MKFKVNKISVLLVFLIVSLYTIKAQNTVSESSYKIVKSNLGTAGASNIVYTAKGKYLLRQSIGQSSVIGTDSKNGFYLRQGYQQPLANIKVEKSNNNNINATLFPNPFTQHVSVSFNEEMKGDISVSIFDLAGKLIYSKSFLPSTKIQLNLENFSNGSYVLKANCNGKLFHAKLIKM